MYTSVLKKYALSLQLRPQNAMQEFQDAVVIKQTGNRYRLCLLPQWEPFTALLRGKMRLQERRLTNPIAVGDHVDGYWPEEGEEAIITAIRPRRNYIIRRSTNLSRQAHVIAANIDCAFLVLSYSYPETSTAFIDRFLVTCEAYGVPVTLLLNKADTPQSEACARLREIYEPLGYPIRPVSATKGKGIKDLRKLLQGKVSLFAGLSGVGKSSLANAIDPRLDLRTDTLSEAHDTGRHTTTFYEMHPLTGGGYFIDSPGIKGFGLLDIAKEEVYHFFPEFFRLSQGCRFNPCLHLNEPQCAVKQALREGLVAPERYESYIKLLDDQDEKYR